MPTAKRGECRPWSLRAPARGSSSPDLRSRSAQAKSRASTDSVHSSRHAPIRWRRERRIDALPPSSFRSRGCRNRPTDGPRCTERDRSRRESPLPPCSPPPSRPRPSLRASRRGCAVVHIPCRCNAGLERSGSSRRPARFAPVRREYRSGDRAALCAHGSARSRREELRPRNDARAEFSTMRRDDEMRADDEMRGNDEMRAEDEIDAALHERPRSCTSDCGTTRSLRDRIDTQLSCQLYRSAMYFLPRLTALLAQCAGSFKDLSAAPFARALLPARTPSTVPRSARASLHRAWFLQNRISNPCRNP